MSIGNFSFLLGEGELVKKALTILKCSIFFLLIHNLFRQLDLLVNF